MNIFFKKSVSFAVLLMLAACADPRGDHLAVTDTSIAVSPSLKASMAVGQITGGGTYLFNPDAVRDSEFKNALQKSLAAHGLLAENSPAYIIDADIKTHLSSFGAVGDEGRVDETVEYQVTRLADHKVFGTTVKTTHVLPSRARIESEAYDKVTGDNLTQFMQTLAGWNMGSGQ